MTTRVLMLTHRLPFPPNKGDKIRSYHMLRHLAQTCDVDVACVIDDSNDLEYVPHVLKLARRVLVAPIMGRLRKLFSLRAMLAARPITVSYFYSRELQRQVDQLVRQGNIDIVLCFSAAMAEYVFRSRALADRAGVQMPVMDLIDVDSVKWAQYAEGARPWARWVYRYESRTLRDYERKVIDAFDQVFLVTESEIRLLDPRANARKVQALSNGVDLEFFVPMAPSIAAEMRPPARVGAAIVFTGVMDYRPNIDAVTWFVSAVFPTIRQRFTDARFLIVGSKPVPEVLKLACEPGVEVTGYVEDVRNYLAAADICVAPLRIARGIQNKILEAMAMGKAVVCTSQALEGIKADPGVDLLVADGEQDFSKAVLDLLTDPAAAKRMGSRARACVECGYGWDSALRLLDEMVVGQAGRVRRLAPDQRPPLAEAAGA